MDVSTPILDGIAAAEIIKRKHPQTHIVLLTLHNSQELLRKGFQAGARGYLLKADADDELPKALRWSSAMVLTLVRRSIVGPRKS
jgi:two-component system, NarL family, nitrate/nitrite response regulator NarL